MTPTEFAIFKYQHTDRASPGQARRRFVYASSAVAAIASVLAFPFGAALWLVPLIAWFSAPRQLQLGPRYLLCGNAIVYYANVKRVALSRAQGSLRLQSANGQVFVLERDKFPTGARKADKIAKNKAAKFDKVAGKIVEKVRKAASGAEVSGV
jgi:hypothetical protein